MIVWLNPVAPYNHSYDQWPLLSSSCCHAEGLFRHGTTREIVLCEGLSDYFWGIKHFYTCRQQSIPAVCYFRYIFFVMQWLGHIVTRHTQKCWMTVEVKMSPLYFHSGLFQLHKRKDCSASLKTLDTCSFVIITRSWAIYGQVIVINESLNSSEFKKKWTLESGDRISSLGLWLKSAYFFVKW